MKADSQINFVGDPEACENIRAMLDLVGSEVRKQERAIILTESIPRASKIPHPLDDMYPRSEVLELDRLIFAQKTLHLKFRQRIS